MLARTEQEPSRHCQVTVIHSLSVPFEPHTAYNSFTSISLFCPFTHDALNSTPLILPEAKLPPWAELRRQGFSALCTEYITTTYYGVRRKTSIRQRACQTCQMGRKHESPSCRKR